MEITTFNLAMFFALIILLLDFIFIYYVYEEIMYEDLVLGYKEKKDREKAKQDFVKKYKEDREERAIAKAHMGGQL